jgi:thioredoxin reductase/SAM-dependent methyltransferase
VAATAKTLPLRQEGLSIQRMATDHPRMTEKRGDDPRYEVVVIGGGTAGLSGALTLARARRDVLVIDGGSPRNAPAGHVHMYLGREGTPPDRLLAQGRTEVTGYGGRIITGTVVAAERLDAGEFRVSLADGSAVRAARLLLTTGLVDELPEIPGLAERWGRDVLHCPYCHGYEVRDQAIGVVATGPLSVHQALLWRQWSSDVTLFTHTMPAPEGEEAERLAARGITVVDGPVAGLQVTDDRLTGVRLANGQVISRDALTVATRLTARADVAAGLGLQTSEQEMGGHVIGTYLAADPTGATSVPGVWVAGNVANVTEQVIGAAGAGVRAAAAINADLIEEETRRAVELRREEGREHWDARYRESDRIWSGDPNTVLVREVSDLEPGRALDLGAGEGGDAIWLARQGWRVTAVDISAVALERAARHAEEAGVADRIDWQRHDLGTSFPDGEFELVSAQFLHSFRDMPREEILRTAASAVVRGGVLLIVGHAGPAPWDHAHAGVVLPTPEEVLAQLHLPPEKWEVQLCAEHERTQTGPDGKPVTRTDNALKIRRLD